MTGTTNRLNNGGPPRKSLSSQLDRLDGILDGLDKALQGAITESVSAAVTEAIRATLLEVVSNPQVITLLRGVMSPTLPKSEQPAAQAPEPAHPTHVGRVRSAISSAWRWSLAKIRAIPRAIGSRINAVYGGVVHACHQANAIWSLKRPIFIAMLAGLLVGMVSYASSPWFAGVVGGISATGAALGMQLAIFARRLLAGFPAR